MTLVEYEQLIEQAEQMILRCEPREAEYWRGYRRGLNFYFHGKSVGSQQDHFILIDHAIKGCSDPYMAAYTLGYHAGFTGKKPGPKV